MVVLLTGCPKLSTKKPIPPVRSIEDGQQEEAESQEKSSRQELQRLLSKIIPSEIQYYFNEYLRLGATVGQNETSQYYLSHINGIWGGLVDLGLAIRQKHFTISALERERKTFLFIIWLNGKCINQEELLPRTQVYQALLCVCKCLIEAREQNDTKKIDKALQHARKAEKVYDGFLISGKLETRMMIPSTTKNSR